MKTFSLIKRLILLCLIAGGSYGSGFAQLPFTPVDTNFTTGNVIVPPGFLFTVLFREGDTVATVSNGNAPSRGQNDYLCYVPIAGSNTDGYLVVNHETSIGGGPLGNGGPVTVLHVQRNAGTWSVIGTKRSVDFSGVGGTWTNCAGGDKPTAWGTVLSVEEYPPGSNAELTSNGWTDTTDFMGYPRYMNLGFMLEINPVTLNVKKLYAMGRFSHEAALLMPDQKTVYMTDDFSPGIFFKFVADTAGNYEYGQLFAYKQSGSTGSWIPLPRERDSLNVIRDIAISKGATMFIRLEDIEMANDGNIYITETGLDLADLTAGVLAGGDVADHLEPFRVPATETFIDRYGRILKFVENTGQVVSHLEGGAGTDGKTHLSNPDNISIDKARNYLVINEDLNGRTFGRNPVYATQTINEIYYLDLSIPNPSRDDLKRFVIGPAGCETTGPFYTPDHETYFVNIQHPSSSNPYPFDKATTIAITGFTVGINQIGSEIPDAFSLDQNYPNPFNPSTSIKFTLGKAGFVSLNIYDISGRFIASLVQKDLQAGVYEATFDASRFASGTYFYKLETGSFSETKKMILLK